MNTMATPKPLYLTTTLPYVNADPHIGFALELVQADAIARYAALQGRDVFFNTGTDEHGQKIAQRAHEEGKEPQAYTDEFATKFRALKGVLGLSDNLHFIRTTDAHHKAAAQEIWRRCEKAGDIYKKSYKGLYCVGDEMFLRDSDLVNGRCPNHPNLVPQEIEEENYFFRLSKYEGALKEYLAREDSILPEWRRDEALKFVEQGLEDFSVSRNKARLSWGIPVPGDDDQVMYVWFDALTNYISTLGWPEDAEGDFKKYWEGGEVLQLAGKDQVRFQSIMWQAMLISAGIKNTDRVIYHGFITSGGQKMSKSLGNVIDPLSLVNEYGAEAVRYFLLRHIHPFEDSDFTMERFKEAYNSDLANGLGNLASRITTLAERYLPQAIPRPEPNRFPEQYTSALENFEPNRALEYVWTRIQAADQRINAEEPFKLVKTDLEKGRQVISELATELYLIARMLNPFLPVVNEKLKEAILANKKPENLFPRKE